MRKITIEVEGMNEDRIIEQMEKAARMAARAGRSTYVMCRTDEAQMQTPRALPGPSVPSFVQRGKREHMGVIW